MRSAPLAFLVAASLLSAGSFLACGSDDSPPPATTVKKPKPGGNGGGGSSGEGGSGGSSAGTGGSGGSGGAPSGAPQTGPEFAQQYAPAYCAVATPCCKTKGTSTDEASCTKEVYENLVLVQDSATYDKTKGTACLEKLKNLASSPSCAALEAGLPDCLGALTLPVAPQGKAPGEACSSVDDCQAPAQGEVRCEEVGLEPKKICQHVLAGKSGTKPCVGDARQTLAVNDDPAVAVGIVYRCDPGLTCDAATRVCQTAKPAGGSCIASFECTTDTYCDGGTCKNAVADGAACQDDEECSSKSFCSSQSRCKPYLAAGAACGNDPDLKCLDTCIKGACSDPAGSSALVCP